MKVIIDQYERFTLKIGLEKFYVIEYIQGFWKCFFVNGERGRMGVGFFFIDDHIGSLQFPA